MSFKGKMDLIEKLTTRFGQLTMTAIVECPFVNGAEEFLKYIRSRVSVYLVSATPQLDLDQIIKARGLGGYFKDVYGAPISKIETLKQIMLSEKVYVNEIMFVGDSAEDQQAAKFLGIRFIGRKSDRELNVSTNSVFADFIVIKEYFRRDYSV